MLVETMFRSDRERREIIPMDTASFPYVCMHTDFDRYPDRCIPWHWHTAFEIDCVEDGALELRTPEQAVALVKGDVIFVNSGVLHTTRARADSSCRLYAHLFDMHFLSGMWGSVFEEKYFQPVARSAALQIWHIRPDALPRLKMAEAALRAVELSRSEPPGYEFDLREALCAFWRLLLADTEAVRAAAPPRSTADAERIKIMMGFIHDHCAEKLTLEDIAAAASVSIRECTRCFRRCIGLSPNEYLTQCRVRMAAQLLAETGKSVLEISEDCGFSSPSYFGKVFRGAMGSTPQEYRRSSH